MMEIRTNKITNVKFDFDKLDQLFDFFLISKDDKKKPYSKILDEPLISKNVVAIQYTGGPSFVVMMRKDKSNKKDISDMIERYNTEHDGTLSQKKLDVYFKGYEHSLLQILFNSLSKSKKEENLSNLGGKLYYFCKKKSKQLLCIEIKIDGSFCLRLNLKTFTERLEKGAKEREYVLQPNNTLRLKMDDDKLKKIYVDFQFAGSKNEVKFLDFGTESNNSDYYKKFYSSKMGVLYRVIERFKKEYGSLVQFEFETSDGWERTEANYASSQKNKHIKFLKSFYSDKEINIVDGIGSSKSVKIANNLKSILETHISPKSVCISNELDKKYINVYIINDIDYYEKHKDEVDPHCNHRDIIVQHITLDKFILNDDSTLSANCIVVLNELVVKYDLTQSSCISFNEWNHYNDKLLFCLCERDKSVDRYFFLEIEPDGRFVAGELTDQQVYSDIKDIFDLNNMSMERHNRYDEKYKGVVKNSKGDVNIIQDTPLYMLPNFESIAIQLKENSKVSKKIDSLSETFGASIDIHHKIDTNENRIYYSVGTIGKGISSDIARATKIRKVISYENSPLFFQDIINTMNVQFVRHGQLTVMPFPFKYLREYAKMVIEG